MNFCLEKPVMVLLKCLAT